MTSTVAVTVTYQGMTMDLTEVKLADDREALDAAWRACSRPSDAVYKRVVVYRHLPQGGRTIVFEADLLAGDPCKVAYYDVPAARHCVESCPDEARAARRVQFLKGAEYAQDAREMVPDRHSMQ